MDGRRIADALLAALIASRCAACDCLLAQPTRGTVCPECWAAIATFTPPLCRRCGDPLPSWRAVSRGSQRCVRCRRVPRPLDGGRAVGPYKGALRAIVHAFKYDGRRSLARPLAQLVQRHAEDLLSQADLAVPVPLHWSRQHRRGFNQAAELTAHLGLPVVHALCRHVRTQAQVTLPSARRHANVRGAFVPARRAWWRRGPTNAVLRGRTIVLVDDVCTTGATLDACARVLKAEGARRVLALTVAKVVAWRPR
ncbi:MAG: ComF family protein [Vicinamibacterales bacterium]|jgi:ComF family protein|nr:amidophosphoribosyltransferase [Acidobacteriota bacterium]MDP6374165.1 ComF family protein [Vicinamibacterales bacterium]MDP6610229.1 ComF family protein [Vicinamibacterales bacterium]HAK55243.1 amidophosphoribosyltransferase [Acidobacteriota bacterium]|tara:strand:+ start:13160 stop:13918 length:759 start_codon:yes stop_codon:yes gene_type:complete